MDTTVEPGTDQVVEIKSSTIELRAKCGSVEVDHSKIVSDEMYAYIFKIGLETIINKVGMSKIAAGLTKLSGEAHAKAVEAVRKQALANIDAIYAGEIKGMKATTKVSGAVNTEAMRLAKAVVKDTLRSNGYKISAFDAKEITAYAKEVLKSNPTLYKTAEENLKAREAETKGTKGFDLKALLGDKADNAEFKAKPKTPPKPKAKGEKAPLSAKQAGMVAPRAKPAPHQTQH